MRVATIPCLCLLMTCEKVQHQRLFFYRKRICLICINERHNIKVFWVDLCGYIRTIDPMPTLQRKRSDFMSKASEPIEYFATSL